MQNKSELVVKVSSCLVIGILCINRIQKYRGFILICKHLVNRKLALCRRETLEAELSISGNTML